MSEAIYIHGTDPEEQLRLAGLGDLVNDAFIRFLEIGPNSSILDVGCGLGILTRRLAQLTPAGELWGVERSAEQLAKAVPDLPNLHFRQADAHALTFAEATFDVVFCRFLLEHVTNPAQVVAEMRRVLKPGGKAFVMENDIYAVKFDPDCRHFDALWRQFGKLQQMQGGDPLIGKKLFRLFREAGFEGVSLSIQPEVHWFGMPTFRIWVENLLNNVRPCEDQLVAKGLVTADDIEKAKGEMAGFMANESGSALFYWNRVRGVKPF